MSTARSGSTQTPTQLLWITWRRLAGPQRQQRLRRLKLGLAVAVLSRNRPCHCHARVLIRRQRLAAFRRMTSCVRLAKAVAELHRALVKDRVAATSPGPMCVLWVPAHSTCGGRRPFAPRPRGDHRTAQCLSRSKGPDRSLVRVFATLRGPLFALGDEALLAFRQQAPFLRHSSLPDLSVRSPSFQYVHYPKAAT
jgi:hypothetical protein